MTAKELIEHTKHIRSIQDSHLFTCEEGDSKHTLGRGVGINWPLWREIKAIVQAYLATVRDDDDEPLTEEWLLSVGGQWVYAFIEFGEESAAIKTPATRGEFRSLCKALKVELKE